MTENSGLKRGQPFFMVLAGITALSLALPASAQDIGPGGRSCEMVAQVIVSQVAGTTMEDGRAMQPARNIDLGAYVHLYDVMQCDGDHLRREISRALGRGNSRHDGYQDLLMQEPRPQQPAPAEPKRKRNQRNKAE